MGMMIGSFNTNGRTITLRNADGSVAGHVTRTGGTSAGGAKKQKRLQYNFKQVSARILQAKTSGNAGQTVIMARAKLAELRQKIKGGEYDDDELAAAILHAEKMVRIARKKQKNLKAEENAERGIAAEPDPMEEEQDEELSAMEDFLSGDPGMSREDLEEQMAQMERMLEEAMRAEEEMSGMDELSEDMLAAEENLDPADLEMRRKKHRTEEFKAIVEADMKYLKTLFDKLAREKQNAAGGVRNTAGQSSSGGVSLELGGAEVSFSSAEMPVSAEGGNFDMTV